MSQKKLSVEFHTLLSRLRAVPFRLARRLISGLLALLLSGPNALHAGALDPLENSALDRLNVEKSLFMDIALAGNRLVAVGERGHILYSDDAGSHWRQSEVPVSVSLTSVHFVSDLQGWAVGHDGVILNSMDGGASWQLHFDGFALNQLLLESTERAFLEAEQAFESGELDERTFEDLSFALEDLQHMTGIGATRPLMKIWFADARSGFALGAYNTLLRTADGGETWQSHGAKLDNPQNFHLNAITASANGDLFIVGESGLVLRSSNQGEAWERLDFPNRGSLFGVLASREGWIVAFGLRGSLFLSGDNGDSWERIDTHTNASIFGGSLFASGAGAALATQDGELLFFDNDRKRIGRKSPDRGYPLLALEHVPRSDDDVLRFAVAGVKGIQIVEVGFDPFDMEAGK
ncbi:MULTISPECIES: WD40/YVTN/BNR-like repeat-containing protein [Pseudomonadaceae]|uniref:Glycosyl hydrolase n=1 Tax=Stutzerimonas chloritidismutans TaxID=203192 RepID=A0ACC5VNH9_STUCH|nr:MULTISPECIES: YCF48-related protein [Pseudomonadaceae]MBX7274266.1 glycosyl hydrolase [Stutzerimonas chloritidismutans]RUJ41886.1 hypothetical protein IPC331_34360 [Pseudomonas aeruginosa]